MSKRPLVIAFFIIIAAYLGNGIYYDQMQLDEGFFLDHYYELDTRHFLIELHYLENHNEKNKAAWIELQELDNLRSRYSHTSNPGASPYQQVRTFTFDSSFMSIDDKQSLAGLEIQDATVYYENGEVKTLPIGTIRFITSVNNTEGGEDQLPLNSYSTGGSSNNTGFVGSKAAESLTISSVKPLTEIPSMKSSFCFEVTATGIVQDSFHDVGRSLAAKHDCDPSIYPMALDKDDTLWLNYRFTSGPGEYTMAKFYIAVEGLREDHTPFQYLVFVHNGPSLSDKDIRTIIKQRRILR